VSVSLADFSVPLFVRALTNLSNMLDKGAAYAAARKFDPSVLADLRLYPDMFPLKRQVQIACDTVKGAAARLGGVDIPKHEDTETTIDELKARIAKTIAFVKSVDPAKIAGAESTPITLKFPNSTLQFNGKSYLSDFVLPNLYFHVTTTYALLRHNGVEVGKGDFLA